MTFSRPMGRKPSPFDARDYKLTRFIPKGIGRLSLVEEKEWDFPLLTPLDQEMTNHCVGFSGANWGINLPVQRRSARRRSTRQQPVRRSRRRTRQRPWRIERCFRRCS